VVFSISLVVGEDAIKPLNVNKILDLYVLFILPQIAMKALIIVISLITISFSANAQWYYKECQVTDINDCTLEEFECLWNSATTKSYQGMRRILLGSACIIGGVFIMGSADLYGEEYLAAYLSVCTIGTVLFVNGIIVGSKARSLKTQLRNTSIYKSQNDVATNLSPTINRNYNNECQVPDINNQTLQEYECLWNSAVTKSNEGARRIVLGSACVVAGAAFLENAIHYGEDYASVGVCIAGTVLLVNGIIVGSKARSLKTKLRNNSIYKSQNDGALNLSPTIFRNRVHNTYSIGLTASFSF